MNIKSKKLTIKRIDINTYDFESESFSEKKITECQLMTLLGAVLGVTITDEKKSDNIYFCISVTMISPE